MKDWLFRIAACSAIAFSSVAAAQAEPLDVVATFSIIGDFAAEVGGDRIRLKKSGCDSVFRCIGSAPEIDE
ncbi:hypothetical protein [Paracoccus mutanolyticus]|uniref:hypothetical protein n=1 Tax=Paracoccus mutanolyticus TaxID=1499308 RepID=UPI001CB89723|nr:hypothetical protein [Paracoccus mutanolyticus]